MDENTEKPAAGFAQRYGNYTAGLLAPLAALVAAYFMPAHAKELVSGAGTLAIFALMFSAENQPYVRRLLGMALAVVPLVAAFLIHDQVMELLSAAGTIAGATIMVTHDKW